MTREEIEKIVWEQNTELAKKLREKIKTDSPVEVDCEHNWSRWKRHKSGYSYLQIRRCKKCGFSQKSNL